MQRSEDGALTHASRAEDGSAKQGKTPESSKGGSMKAGRRGQGAGTPPSTDQSRRPAKQIKEAAPSSSQLMQGTPYPGQSGSLGNPPWGQYGGAEDDGCGGHDDREHDAHAAAAAATQHADGALQLGDGGGGAAAAAADAPLTETVAAGLVAMASRRAVLLDKIDVLTEVGVQGIEQLKTNFKADMSRLRAQVQEYCDEQEQAWRQLSAATRAAEERLRSARGLVETLNAQGLGTIQM